MGCRARLGSLRCTSTLAVLIFTTLVAIASANGYEYQELEDWVRGLGGSLRTRIADNENGIRGLYATENIYKGDKILSIPSTALLNVGSLDGTFVTPTLLALREVSDPNSRLAPFMRIIPKRGEIINGCTLGTDYWPLLENDYWQSFAQKWQGYLRRVLAGEVNSELEYTVKEVMHNKTVTFEDLAYACAVSATRYVSTTTRRRLLMVPLFDMANHHPGCPHYMSDYANEDAIHLIAGADIPAGGEVCYSYGDMRDDYAVLHYGFLPAPEDPPRLLSMDVHGFGSSWEPGSEPEGYFQGSYEETEAEIQRLEGILSWLEALDAAKKAEDKEPVEGDWVRGMLLELQQRRRVALRHEIERLEEVVLAMEEQQEAKSECGSGGEAGQCSP